MCSDPNRPWYSYRRICYASMEREAAEAAFAKLHEKAKWHDGSYSKWTEERDAGHAVPAAAGMTIGVAPVDLHPWDDFTRKVDASPVPPSESAGDLAEGGVGVGEVPDGLGGGSDVDGIDSR